MKNYVGELMDHQEKERRDQQMRDNNETEFYFFTLKIINFILMQETRLIYPNLSIIHFNLIVSQRNREIKSTTIQFVQLMLAKN